jgi:hypothetical protein
MKTPELFSLVLGFGLVGCGAAGSTADLALMDAPPAGVTAVVIQVAAMQVHVEDNDDATDSDSGTSIDDDSKWESLSVNRSIDLVQHQGETAAELLGQLPLPPGKITQIRLVIDTAGENYAVKDGQRCSLDTAKVAKKGIKIGHPFKAFKSVKDTKHFILVDVDLERSLNAKGDCFELDPKIELKKVKIDDQDFPL